MLNKLVLFWVILLPLNSSLLLVFFFFFDYYYYFFFFLSLLLMLTKLFSSLGVPVLLPIILGTDGTGDEHSPMSRQHDLAASLISYWSEIDPEFAALDVSIFFFFNYFYYSYYYYCLIIIRCCDFIFLILFFSFLFFFVQVQVTYFNESSNYHLQTMATTHHEALGIDWIIGILTVVGILFVLLVAGLVVYWKKSQEQIEEYIVVNE